MTRFAKYAWAVLAYNLAVILWGAYVRASGAGAGCGSHWPLCNGVVIPREPALTTLIELTHRVTSGIALLLVVVLFLWSRQAAKPGDPTRVGATFSLVFMITEALVGAGLVLLKLVADNASLARALWLGGHLINTFLLLASLTLTAWWASGRTSLRIQDRGGTVALLGVALFGTLAVATTGAVTALGDTLFPSTSVVDGLRQDASPTAHLLIRVRVLHPALALIAGAYLVVVSAALAGQTAGRGTRYLSRAVAGLVTLQWVAGATNVLLLAPIWLQLVHLLLADLLWISLVLLAASALAAPVEAAPTRIRPTGAAPEAAGASV